MEAFFRGDDKYRNTWHRITVFGTKVFRYRYNTDTEPIVFPTPHVRYFRYGTVSVPITGGQPICLLDEASPALKTKKYPAFNNPSFKYGNPVSRIVGNSGKRQYLLVRLITRC